VVTKELLNFIQSELQVGKTPDSIVPSLTDIGWQPQDIQLAFSQLGVNVNMPNVPGSISKLFKLSAPLLIGIIILILGVSAVLGYWGYKTLFPQKNTEQNKITKEAKPSLAPTPTAVPTQAMISDCGTEELNINLTGQSASPPAHIKLQCFINAAKTCTSSKLTLNSSINFAGITTSKVDYDIKSSSNRQCSLHLKQIASDHIFPTEVPQQDRENTLKVLRRFDNTEGVCLFVNNSDLAEIFSKLDRGEFTMSTDPKDSPYAKGQCSGAYFDLLYKPIQPSQ